MRLVPIIASIIFASALLGYGFAQAQSSTPFGTPTTASHPYSKICGDHPCKPGEVYNPGQASANTTSSAGATAGKNGTTTGGSSVKISANATATKTNGTATKGAMTNATGAISTGMSENATAKAQANMTKVSTNMTETTNMTATTNMTSTSTAPKPVESPDKQVASGAAPSDVKCPTGFQLALNKFDQRPACVTADIYAKLVARGWAS